MGGSLALEAPVASAYTVPDKMKWWYAARFGMFIHFGSYSYLGHGEWAFTTESWTKEDYQTQVSAHFNPQRFSARQIVSLAKHAGMKYLVITAKHHEGFAMWDAKVPSFTDTTGTKLYNLPSYTPYKPDLLAELKAECHKQGIKFGLYYSIIDWNHPSQYDYYFTKMKSFEARTAYIRDMKLQLKDLLRRYDPAILWFDGDWCDNHDEPNLTDWWIKSDGQDLYDYLVAIKPSLVVNERVKRNLGLGDFECPEQYVPDAPPDRLWETNTTMNGAWGYNEGLDNAASYKTPAELIQELVKVISRDGNYLLNIGPKGDGTVPDIAVDILHAFGTWTSVHGESIYGATASPFSTEPTWGFYTKKSGHLYAHVCTWPTDGKLVIPALSKRISHAYLLEKHRTPLKFTVDGGNIILEVPATAPDSNVSVVVLRVAGVPAAAVTA